MNCGHEVTVLMARRFGDGSKCEKIDGIDVRWSSIDQPSDHLNNISSFLRSRLNLMRDILHIVSKKRIDWIISHVAGLDVLVPGLLATLFYRVRLASQYGDIVHSDVNIRPIQSLNAKLGQYLGARGSHLILYTGSNMLESHLHKLSPRTKIAFLPPPVDTQMFVSATGSEFLKRYQLNGFKLITYVGSFKPFEGLEDLAIGLAPLLMKDNSIRLVLVGGNVKTDLSRLKKTIAKLPVNNQIFLPGPLDLQDVANVLAASQVLVLPKINHQLNHHAMPIKLGEYLASGKPVVCSAIGGIKEYLIHGVNGFLYPPGDINSMKQCVEKLLYEEFLAKKIGHTGRQTALSIFDINVVAENLINRIFEFEKSCR